MIPMARLPAHYAASRSRQQVELPPAHQPPLDPDTNRDSEAREALSPPTTPDPDIRRDLEGQASDGTGSPTEWLPEPVLV